MHEARRDARPVVVVVVVPPDACAAPFSPRGKASFPARLVPLPPPLRCKIELVEFATGIIYRLSIAAYNLYKQEKERNEDGVTRISTSEIYAPSTVMLVD